MANVSEISRASKSYYKYCPKGKLYTLLGDFRFEYEYEIQYKCDFSIIVFRLHIIMSHIKHISWPILSIYNQLVAQGLWKHHWFEFENCTRS